MELCSISGWGGPSSASGAEQRREGEGAAAALPLPAHLKAVAACSAFPKRGPYRSHRPVMVWG